jgi:voltage-gated potassium channel
MLIGYSIIAVPTGILSAEIGLKVLRPFEGASAGSGEVQAPQQEDQTGSIVCGACRKGGHDPDALHCKFCGAEL